MPDQAELLEILQLLAELEARTTQDPLVSAEWNEEWERCGQRLGLVNPTAMSPADELLFREWFLLERSSHALGSVPAQAWSPREVEADSAWARLLDQFLGLFRVEGVRRVEGQEVVDVVDLWSGRLAHLHREAVPVELLENPEDGVLLARLVTGIDDVHLPLPASRWSCAPGIAVALEQDLALARHHQPRAQLSQLECRQLLQIAAAAESEPEDAAQCEQLAPLTSELELLLSKAPGWDLDRIQDSLNRHGLDETLNALAFETQVDLEAMRRTLPAWTLAAQKEEPQGKLPAEPLNPGLTDEPVDSGEALRQFDQARAAGKSLDEAFLKLEQSLGLEPGSSRENPLEEAEQDPTGFGLEQSPGLQAWVQAYLWEQPSASANANALESLARHAEATAGKTLDASELSAPAVLSFLLVQPDGRSLSQMRLAIHSFLVWAAQEQDADLGAALDDWAAPEDERLPCFADANAIWISEDRAMPSRTALAQVDPARVMAEGNELAPVDGLPNALLSHLRKGDLLLGNWRAGRFEAARIVPREALPSITNKAADAGASEELN